MKKPFSSTSKLMRTLGKTSLARTISAALLGSFLTGAAAPIAQAQSDDDRFVHVHPTNSALTVTAPTPAKSRGYLQILHAQTAVKLATAGFTLGNAAFVKIFKEERALEMWIQKEDGAFKRFKRYAIKHIHNDKLGPKIKQGDYFTPEGVYEIPAHFITENTQYYLAIDFAYPNALDRSLGRTGSLVRIHGDAPGSAGCPVMTNEDAQEIYSIAKSASNNGYGFTIYSFPFEMTAWKLMAHRGHKAMAFWQNELQPIYEALNQTNRPVKVSTVGKRYALLDGTTHQPVVAYTSQQQQVPIRSERSIQFGIAAHPAKQPIQEGQLSTTPPSVPWIASPPVASPDHFEPLTLANGLLAKAQAKANAHHTSVLFGRQAFGPQTETWYTPTAAGNAATNQTAFAARFTGEPVWNSLTRPLNLIIR